MKTRITELFGVEHPIIQGGLMWIATAELTSAVANAGAMGFMTALTHETPEGLREEIHKCRDMTDKPFGINLTFLPSLRQPDYAGYLQVCAEEGIEFIETAGRNPEPFMPHLKAAGMKVIHKCTSVRHARKAQTIGCDAVAIDGFECAGHPGEDDVTSLVLLPATADALDIPIVASGGFGDGRGLVAALVLGADGMNMGTRFVATQETPIHPAIKQAIVDHGETDTTLIMRTLRNTERVLNNETARTVLEIESTGTATINDLIPYVSGRRGLQEVVRHGNVDGGTISVGQVMGIIHDIPTVGELIDRIMKEAEDLISRGLPGLLG
jgi:NAD(P)H-dependent flavin oxidoreductase YrpB (nitropropane dioxygenase family)